MIQSDPVYLDPVRGDEVQRGENTYRVVSRGVASSVRFVRLVKGRSLQGQKSLPCWRRLVQNAVVTQRGPR